MKAHDKAVITACQSHLSYTANNATQKPCHYMRNSGASEWRNYIHYRWCEKPCRHKLNSDAQNARHESHYAVNAQNSAYFQLKRTLRVQSQFVYVRVCSLSFDRRCYLSWKQARKKSNIHFVPFIPVADLRIMFVK